jgi:hypothetical protein
MGIYNRYANIKIQRPNDDSYPKWIDRDGIEVLVNSAQEEFPSNESGGELLQKPQSNPDGFGESFPSKAYYRIHLYSQAIDLGVPAKKTWGIEKLRKAINDYSK